MTEETKLATICPFCGDHIVRTEVTAGGGTVAESACCWMPTEIIDNWSMISKLPEALQKAAIDGKKAEHAALYAKWNEEAAAFIAARKEYQPKLEKIYYGGNKRWL
jgi:hypothetical protein